MYVIVSFRSRNQTMSFLQILLSYKIRASIINTPRKATVSCGTSVKMPTNALEIAKGILSRRRFDSFAGFFLVEEGQNTIVRPIN